VHSGKYTTERDTARIRDASIRLDAIHPTVNDRQFRLWRAYAVRAWPTLVAIDPRGAVIGMQAGEFTADDLGPFIERVIGTARAEGTLREEPLHVAADAPSVAPDLLAFPGKVAVRDRRVAIADSGHHRVLLGTLDASGERMQVERTIGGAEPGYRDGEHPLFQNPQGLALDRDTLYVADAGNHVVRAVSLDSGASRTIAGTGQQLRRQRDLEVGALSSPWDLTLIGDMLYVAMAGVHRLWAIELATGKSAPFSGSGAEELHDGPHAEAALAQPMGICAMDDTLYIVDAESSAVRAVDRDASGGVHTIVGTGLFDFGDVDGVGDDVRMQHQQGMTAGADGRLLVCDSYNDALKWVDPVTRRAERWLGGFHEPSGVALTERAAYVADTNAHRVMVVNLASGATRPLDIER
jgi:hypothetical protein